MKRSHNIFGGKVTSGCSQIRGYVVKYQLLHCAWSAFRAGVSKKNKVKLTGTITSVFAFMAGIAGLLDTECTDKTVNEEEQQIYAEIQTFTKCLRFGPLRKSILNGSGSSWCTNEDITPPEAHIRFVFDIRLIIGE